MLTKRSFRKVLIKWKLKLLFELKINSYQHYWKLMEPRMYSYCSHSILNSYVQSQSPMTYTHAQRSRRNHKLELTRCTPTARTYSHHQLHNAHQSHKSCLLKTWSTQVTKLSSRYPVTTIGFICLTVSDARVTPSWASHFTKTLQTVLSTCRPIPAATAYFTVAVRPWSFS